MKTRLRFLFLKTMGGLLVNCKHVHLSQMYMRKNSFIITPGVTWELKYYKFIRGKRQTSYLDSFLTWWSGGGGWRVSRKLWGFFGDKVLKWNNPQISRVDTHLPTLLHLGTSNPEPSKSFLTQWRVIHTHSVFHFCSSKHGFSVMLAGIKLSSGFIYKEFHFKSLSPNVPLTSNQWK